MTKKTNKKYSSPLRTITATRSYWSVDNDDLTTTLSTLSDETQSGVGVNYCEGALFIRYSNFVTSTSNPYGRIFEEFRFLNLEVYVKLPNKVDNALIYCSVDSDDRINPGNWKAFQQRPGITRTIVTPLKPQPMIREFRPTAHFVTQTASSDATPFNMVVDPNQWFDIQKSIDQEFLGLKVWCELNAPAPVGLPYKVRFYYRATIEFRYRGDP